MTAPGRPPASVHESPSARHEPSSAYARDLDSLSRAHLTPARMFAMLAALTAILIVSVVAGATFGSVHISIVRAFKDAASPDHAIFFGARLPRVLMGVVVGAVLAAVGAALQGLVRNPLAEGGILGISGGGALGAIIALVALANWPGAERDRSAGRIRRGPALDRRRISPRAGRRPARAVHAAAGRGYLQCVLGRRDHAGEQRGEFLLRPQHPVLADGQSRIPDLWRSRDRCGTRSGRFRDPDVPRARHESAEPRRRSRG